MQIWQHCTDRWSWKGQYWHFWAIRMEIMFMLWLEFAKTDLVSVIWFQFLPVNFCVYWILSHLMNAMITLNTSWYKSCCSCIQIYIEMYAVTYGYELAFNADLTTQWIGGMEISSHQVASTFFRYWNMKWQTHSEVCHNSVNSWVITYTSYQWFQRPKLIRNRGHAIDSRWRRWHIGCLVGKWRKNRKSADYTWGTMRICALNPH